MGVYVAAWGEGNVAAVTDEYVIVDASSRKAQRELQDALAQGARVRMGGPPPEDGTEPNDGLIEEEYKDFAVGGKGHIYAALTLLDTANIGVDDADLAEVIGAGFII
jgi:hypothetical protein